MSELPIAPEDITAHYTRDDLPTWAYLGRGCDIREQILLDRGHNARKGKRCKPTGGTWTATYTGDPITKASKVDLDHLVPLAEVARSGRITNGGQRIGPTNWSEQQREDYANDPSVLVISDQHSNRTKGDDDPARWLPQRDQCGYTHHWIAVKAKYALSVDQTEHDVLARVLASC